VRIINLTKGKVATVDDEDYEWLNQHRWGYVSRYAARYVNFNGKNKYMYMHREIMGLAIDDPREVDHWKNTGTLDYGLDNRRDNLRVCDTTQNQGNGRIRIDNTSGYRGVSWHKPLQKWRAHMKHGDITYNLGYFDDIIEAAKAYDRKAKELFGEFANLNFPDEEYG
jgi:hypothetical protein